jgi:hypothetical protein
MQGVANFLSVPAIADTLNRLSYGESLTTGAGGVGGTTRLRPEALEAAMVLAPMSVPAGRATNAAAMAAGRAGERFAERAIPSAMDRGGITAEFLRAMGSNTVSPLDVYHGSPHKFDRFDASKIGTGEGAQAFGHGLYFAESPEVAGQYQRMLGGIEMRDKDGKIIPIPENVQWVAKDLAEAGGDYGKVRAQLAEHGKMYPWPAEVGTKYINELEAIGAKPSDLGSLYKVDLPDEAVSKMLDWDKPLSEQPKSVRNALKGKITYARPVDGFDMGGNANLRYNRKGQIDKTSPNPWLLETINDNGISRFGLTQKDVDRMFGEKNESEITGSQILSRITQQTGSQKKASDYLRSLGIPGIRYLDQGSRGAGQGTSNFVVFPGNENMLTILERNNQPVRQAIQDFERGLKNYIDSRSK